MNPAESYQKYIRKPLIACAIIAGIYASMVLSEYNKSYSRDSTGQLKALNDVKWDEIAASARTVNRELSDLVLHPWIAFSSD